MMILKFHSAYINFREQAKKVWNYEIWKINNAEISLLKEFRFLPVNYFPKTLHHNVWHGPPEK